MKRHRDGTEVNHDLVSVYDDLANEDSITRLKAATSLLKIYAANENQQLTIIKRLFRGLCSGRKAARLGFAVALTETLSTLPANSEVSRSEIVSILEKQTRPDGGVSGQDERDHYFGRLFGSEAIIKSGVLFANQDMKQWDQLLDTLCKLAVQKPWLRQGCGWALFACVKISLNTSSLQPFAVRILEKLAEHKLIRTPEGLAIWILVGECHPRAKLPKNVWKHDDPLTEKDLYIVANVLKDAKDDSKQDSDYGTQGSATWSVNLHFVWDVVLARLLAEQSQTNQKSEKYFQQFWQEAVDQSLFKPTNSAERKLWGLLVVQKALEITSTMNEDKLDIIFSKNAVSCLIQSLKSTERYLGRSAQLIIETMLKMARQNPQNAGIITFSILRAADYLDFDVVTKTRLIADLIDASPPEALKYLVNRLHAIILRPEDGADKVEIAKLRSGLSHVFKIVVNQVQRALHSENTASQASVIKGILEDWLVSCAPQSPLTDANKKLVLEKLELGLEQVLRLGQPGRLLILNLVNGQSRLSQGVHGDDQITAIVEQSQQKLDNLQHSLIQTAVSSTPDSEASVNIGLIGRSEQHREGLALLFALLLLQVYTGDHASLDTLQELLDCDADTENDEINQPHSRGNDSESLVEIILSFASKPSKFLRRITLIIFELLTAEITSEGLQILFDILVVKESKTGQNELFQENDEATKADIDADAESDLGSDVEMIDVSKSASLDIDINEGQEDKEGGSDDDNSDETTNSSASDTDADSDDEAESDTSSESDMSEKDASLLALEASLATALGTRKITSTDLDQQVSSSSDSDSDASMSDSEMLDLDVKLAEVFRARASAKASSSKKENKSARENVVNFKNRVLDMLEVYLKKETQNPRSLDTILPLLALARSNTKQLADRAVKILTMYCKKCGGLEKVPDLTLLDDEENDHSSSSSSSSNDSDSDNDKSDNNDHLSREAKSIISLLRAIHAMSLLPNTSNAHRTTCSKCSILVAKSLLKVHAATMEELQGVYDDTFRFAASSSGSNTVDAVASVTEVGGAGVNGGQKKKKTKSLKMGKVDQERQQQQQQQSKQQEQHQQQQQKTKLPPPQQAFFDNWTRWKESVKGRV